MDSAGDSLELNLSLSLKLSYVPKTLTSLLKDLSKIDNFSHRLRKLSGYLRQHKQELARAEGFKHQIPKFMLLLLDSIETLKDEVMKMKKNETNERFLMEFLTIRRRTYEAKLEKQHHEKQIQDSLAIGPCNPTPEVEEPKRRPGKEVAEGSGSDWLSLKLNYHHHQPLSLQSKPISKPAPKGSRKIWSKELHGKFVKAIESLGGAQAATPRHINDIMDVEGLTNDQVKSHLQKYRIHLKKEMAAKEEAVPEESVGESLGPSEFYYNTHLDPSEFYYNTYQTLRRITQSQLTLSCSSSSNRK